MLLDVNWLAVLCTTVLIYLLGWAWYSPFLFGKIWCRLTGTAKNKEPSHGIAVYTIAFALTFLAVLAFAALLSAEASMMQAVLFALVIGVCWVGTSFGINYLFSGRPYQLLLIDAGYHIAQFVICGVVLSWWH